MSDKENEPKSALSLRTILKIMFLMAIFISMVQNNGFENLILIFCLIMFCLPVSLIKWARNKYESFDISTIQQIMQQWYETNVTNHKQPNSTKISAESKTTVFDEDETDFFSNIPAPPPDSADPPYPIDEDIWVNVNNEEGNNHEQQ